MLKRQAQKPQNEAGNNGECQNQPHGNGQKVLPCFYFCMALFLVGIVISRHSDDEKTDEREEPDALPHE